MEKRDLLLYGFLCLGLVQACTPEEDLLVDFDAIEVAKVELGADHRQLIADGVSTLTLNPMLFQKYSYVTDEGKDSTVYGKIPADRIPENTVRYFLEDGTELNSPKYKTTDLSKSEIGFYIEAGGMKSEVFKVALRAPFAADAYETIVYPVVFHIIQDEKNVSLGQGVGTDIVYYAFNTINNVFSRAASTSPNGADTRIRFRLAEYDPDGKKLTEKGINRYPMPKDELGDLELETIKNNAEICWDYKRYLNIWIVDGMSAVSSPQYILETADLNQIQGIEINALPLEGIEQQEYDLTDIGFIFKAKDFATEDVDYAGTVGKFFGLLDTKSKKEDYCDDTMVYSTYKEPWNTVGNASNSRLKISDDGLLFYSVNIMDESTYGNTISMDQVKRIRTITDNCPHRWAYKSDWAFVGNK